MIKRFIIVFILLVLVVGGIVGFNLFRDQAIKDYFAHMPVPKTTVSTEQVKPITWTPGVDAIGTASAAQGVDLTVETAGIVKEMLFKANQHVDKGQLLLRLDDEVEQADLDAAKTQVTLDKLALDRAVALQKSGAGTQATLDNARAAYSTSQSQVTKNQAVLDQKLLNAPFSGTLGIPKIDNGQYLTPGTVVVTLQDLDTMRVDFTVPEQQLPDLKIGQDADFGLSTDKMEWKGKITGIEPKIDASSRLVDVRAEVANPDGKLKPGQFLQVRVLLPKEDGVIAVPQTALVSSLYGDYVYVVKPAPKTEGADASGGKASDTKASDTKAGDAKAADDKAGPDLVAAQVFVTVGRHSGEVVEIVKGLKAGDQIVTAGQNRLSNNSPVTVDNTITPPANPNPADVK